VSDALARLMAITRGLQSVGAMARLQRPLYRRKPVLRA
jgi:hypothetical protein